ncbi:hypothetical protein TRFO_23736 [Tritrichomonas foetus]|uniref:Uncharacterized protein n=1 Tax=Tritrichomonas foetus TaxID=1144522 RepID=A0A1J4KDT5_9EUKA|nr:hypothetical protein TRFO_23736 [Tritrichomonas foetus]|eukprot:OHT07876.1 hypothetical protein TRFO_23736 [Tritrichomonas foetus]
MRPAKKSKFAKKNQTNNFPLDFYNRAFAILAYTYGSGPDQSYILPEPAEEVTVKEENRQPFQSRIVDLRLRRNQDQREKVQIEHDEKIQNSYEKYEQMIINSSEDIESVFEPEQAVRPDVPLYLQNIHNDERINSWKYRRKKRPHPMDMKKIEKEYTARLNKSREIGVKRATNRAQLYQQQCGNSCQTDTDQNSSDNYYEVYD